MGKPDGIEINVVQGDVVTAEGDVLALKYAQGLHGADSRVANLLKKSGVSLRNRLPEPGDFHLTSTDGALAAKAALFVGVKELWEFGYVEIREFSRNVLTTLSTEMPDVKHLLLTVHGVNYGLDEGEAFESLIAGLLDAVSAGDFPPELKCMSIVEINRNRATRLQTVLNNLLPEGVIPVPGRPGSEPLGKRSAERFRSAGYLSESKPHIFVAMPFIEEMEDVFHYGIRNTVNAAGYLCERADYASFMGDIFSWIKERISTAELVIADLTGANPNVYLEVGYAMGCSRPTVLLVRDPAELKFDVRGQRCIIYKKIKDLEEKLAQELALLIRK